MTKVTFEFNLPDDQEDFEIYSKAVDTAYKVDSFRNFLRSKWKHEEMGEEAQAQVNQIYEYFCDQFSNQ
jgi:hypothetical protein